MVVQHLVGFVADLPGGDQAFHLAVENDELVQRGDARSLSAGSFAVGGEDVLGSQPALAGDAETVGRGFRQALGHQVLQERPGSVAVVLLVGVSSSYVTLAALPLVMLSSLAILRLTRTKRIQGDAAIDVDAVVADILDQVRQGGLAAVLSLLTGVVVLSGVTGRYIYTRGPRVEEEIIGAAGVGAAAIFGAPLIVGAAAGAAAGAVGGMVIDEMNRR